MTELVGFESWALLAGDSPTSRTEWAAVVGAWSEPHRRYHDLAHLAAVLGLVGALRVVGDVVVPGGHPDGFGVVGRAGQLTDQAQDGGQVREVVVPAMRLAPRPDDGGPLGA